MGLKITTHVLDTARGVPAENIEAVLEWRPNEQTEEWFLVGTGKTNADGRIEVWGSHPPILHPGVFRLTFETGAYFAAFSAAPAFYPVVRVEFLIPDDDPRPAYHIPLLLSPYSYSTYRGS